MFKADGKYKAELKSAEIAETASGEPKVHMVFSAVDEENKTGTFHYDGQLKTASNQEHTFKALVAAGFVGNDLPDIDNPAMFNMRAEFTITLEEYKGKLRVKWVNGGTPSKKFKGTLPSFAGAISKAKQAAGIKRNPLESI